MMMMNEWWWGLWWCSCGVLCFVANVMAARKRCEHNNTTTHTQQHNNTHTTTHTHNTHTHTHNTHTHAHTHRLFTLPNLSTRSLLSCLASLVTAPFSAVFFRTNFSHTHNTNTQHNNTTDVRLNRHNQHCCCCCEL